MPQLTNISAAGVNLTYTYDTLNRLALAQTTAASDALTPGSGQQFGYDGFGNLLSKTPTKGSAPSMSLGIDPATNRVVGTQYDANGNQLSVNLSGYGTLNATYDYDNRLQAAGSFLADAYAPNNKRIYKRNSHIDQFGNVIVDNEELYYYSPTGQKLGTYQIAVSSPPSAPSMTLLGDFNVMPVHVLTDHSTDKVPLRDSIATYELGEQITDTQLTALVILHEFGHALGVPQGTTEDSNRAIFQNCVKGVIP